MLYEKELPSVRRGQPIEAALPDSFPFEPMFDALHPPSEVSPSDGLFDLGVRTRPSSRRTISWPCTPTCTKPSRPGSVRDANRQQVEVFIDAAK